MTITIPVPEPFVLYTVERIRIVMVWRHKSTDVSWDSHPIYRCGSNGCVVGLGCGYEPIFETSRGADSLGVTRWEAVADDNAFAWRTFAETLAAPLIAQDQRVTAPQREWMGEKAEALP